MQESFKRTVYLLTIWQERPASLDHPAVCRYSLEHVRTGEKHGFANLEQMTAFLRQRVENCAINAQKREGEEDQGRRCCVKKRYR